MPTAFLGAVASLRHLAITKILEPVNQMVTEQAANTLASSLVAKRFGMIWSDRPATPRV
jgi:hypothetical protein